MTSRRAWPLAALLLLVCACHALPPPRETAPERTRTVLLISIDGLRNDALGRGNTPHLDRLAREGVRAAWMNPSYPSLTFPNHYSMVTGLRPDRQGIVHNSMQDPALGRFRTSDSMAVGDARWWGGEPVWVGVEKSGRRSATLFWPGSEAAVGGVRPSRWLPFDAAMPASERVARVLSWLDAPAAARPVFVTLYFDQVDHASHANGPGSTEARTAIGDVDAAIGRLVEGLSERGRLDATDLVIVSDHGMAEVAPGHAISVEDMATLEEAAVISVGQVILIAPRAGMAARVERKLLGAHANYDCWRKGELPARWRYGTHPRIPPIVCQMHEGWDALARETLAKRPKDATRGSHGYDPALPSMRAVFLARGPSFRQGATIPAFDNVDVYPLLARLTGIRAVPGDGDIAPLLPALREGAGAD